MEERILASHPQTRSPDFTLRTSAGLVGSGWLVNNQFGKFIKIVPFQVIQKGTTLYLSSAEQLK